MNNKLKNIPELRFPEFEGEWVEKKLLELLNFKNGINASKEDYGSGYKFINVLDIINNDFITHDKIIGSVNVSEFEFQKNKVEYGDILFQRSSETREEVGQANVYLDKDVPATFGGFVIRGKKKVDYNPVFLNYLLKTASARKEITSKSGGSTRYNVGQETLSSVTITTTETPEQTKISTFLTAVDKRINLLQKKKAELEQYKKGVMQKLFSQEIRFKKDDGSDFPDWEEKKLGEVVKVQGGFAFKSSNFKDAGIPVIRISNISNTDNFIDTSNMVYYDKIQIGQNYIIKKGDLLIAMSGATTGKTSIFNLENIAYVNQRVGLFKSLTENLFYPFITQFVLSDNFENQLKSLLVAGAQPNISSNDIESIKIPYPQKQEQQKIANFLSTIDKSIEKLGNQIDESQQWKKGLLQKMFV